MVMPLEVVAIRGRWGDGLGDVDDSEVEEIDVSETVNVSQSAEFCLALHLGELFFGDVFGEFFFADFPGTVLVNEFELKHSGISDGGPLGRET